MVHRIGVEDIEPDHWVAWSFERTGITGRGNTEAEAVEDFKSNLKLSSVEIVEVFRSYPSSEDPNYLVNAFFENDKLPLSPNDVRWGKLVLEMERTIFFFLTLDGIKPEILAQPIENERFGNINGILKHIAVTEWWYCDRLGGVANWDSLPDEPLEALRVSRRNTDTFLSQLMLKSQVVSRVGEMWSPRKLLRRAIWHERDHIEHIKQRLAQIQQQC